ncbi:hypothetical protein [Streptomyces sp. NPDC006012]|uniref:hypothetical protein n=1 Tax=Streptomyces sp. NPDC006012 TaxID=3364739 RepID=UPI003688E91F
MTSCPTHHNSHPPAARHPHNGQSAPLVCKGCLAPAGSEQERRSHHCPCCGEKYASSCLGNLRDCPNCGRLNLDTGQWQRPNDPLTDLLRGHLDPDPWMQVRERAAGLFGRLIAHHLHQVTFEIDRTRLYGEIAVGSRALTVRYADGRFEAASDCPRRAECRRGRVWTPVAGREELLHVHLHGPGRAVQCDRAERHAAGGVR